MNFQNIIENSELIYSFKSRWSLKKVTCNISCYEAYPLEDLDTVICNIIDLNKGRIEENTLASLLGFNVIDDFNVIPKRYADDAEKQLFQSVIKSVLKWHLISKDDGYFILTDLGSYALERNEKYKFFNAQKILFENFNILPSDKRENILFPYYNAFGISSEITSKREINPVEIDLLSVFNPEKTELIERHNLQSATQNNIFKSVLSPYFKIESTEIEISLYRSNEQYYPIIFHGNSICFEANELLYYPDNNKQLKQKIEEGLYKKLINDPTAILSYEALYPFEDLLEFDTLLLDSRLDWQDDSLLDYLWRESNANHWKTLTQNADINFIKSHAESIKENIDWAVLSLRIDDIFLVEHATSLPWNFTTISNDENRSIKTIQSLLLIDELTDEEWDWHALSEKFEYDFIRDNISRLNFDLSLLTKSNSESIQGLIRKHPDKNWDYHYISTDYDLSFILDNIDVLFPFTKLETIIGRGFSDSIWSEKFASSSVFKEAIVASKDTYLKDFSITTQDFIWSDLSINFFLEANVIEWKSGRYVKGFECNPYLNWTKQIFEKYHKYIQTEIGYSHISKSIADTTIIEEYPEFNWDWNAISENIAILKSERFIQTHRDKLEWHIVLVNIDYPIIERLFDELNLIQILSDSEKLWSLFTEKCSIEFVRSHISLDWDWGIITQRFYKQIKTSSLGNTKWVDKWDWSFLTQNLELSDIIEYLELYKERWDWQYLSEHLEVSFILANLEDYNDYWEWSTLLASKFTSSDFKLNTQLVKIATCFSVLENEKKFLLWSQLTKCFSFTELKDIILQTSTYESFNWDLKYFTNHPDFHVRKYLDECIEIVDWNILSGSNNLNRDLKWDKQLWNYKGWINDVVNQLDNNDYQWDFKNLSRLDSINWNDQLLFKYKDKFDWEFLSEYSTCFSAHKDLLKRFGRFSRYINFKVFSKRADSEISEKLLSKYIDENWDWEALSSNTSISISAEFIRKNESKKWDWQALSQNDNIILNNSTIIELADRNWNWELLSNRTDLQFTSDFIKQLYTKPFNWYAISQNQEFTPNIDVLLLIGDKEIDWERVSQKIDLETNIEVLSKFHNKVNWKSITSNPSLNISDRTLLKNYQDHLDWHFISNSDRFILDIDNLIQFKSLLNWEVINSRNDFEISQNYLEPLSDVINWSIASSSMLINFNEVIIEKYRNNWDWRALSKNPQVIEKLDNILTKYKPELNVVHFLERFEEKNREPYIYHFTHLFNAVEVIKSRKILSRNMAEGKFANAAGTLVDRRNDAHGYARFYFRPQTPTQFYNECLGWDSNSGYLKQWSYYGEHFSKWVTYYPQARNLGLPKCPIPVFFKFSLKEVLNKLMKNCFYSSGNMQTNWSKVYKVSENPDNLNVEHLYSDISDGIDTYKEYSQQEFLILNELDFSELNSFEIICYNEEYESLLKNLIGKDILSEKINSDGWGVFHRNNRRISFADDNDSISISSDYSDDAYFAIKSPALPDIKILNPENIKKESKDEIYAYPSISFEKTSQPIEVRFVDKSIGIRDWIIYTNSSKYINTLTWDSPFELIKYISNLEPEILELYKSKVRHYTIEKHTSLVLNQFEEYFINNDLGIDKNIFRTFLALHDIGKPLAESNGNRAKQHSFTVEIIKKVWSKLAFPSSSLSIAIALASEDVIGEYFQNKISLEIAIGNIVELANHSNLPLFVFFKLYIIYYQCDTGSYTKDAGGLKFLEHLFEYNGSGQKVFDASEGLLKFSSNYWAMYIHLKETLCKLN
jgi:hypothetical protein